MRLINTRTLKFRQFETEDGLEYAILSHRWGAGEVSYRNMKRRTKHEKKKGFEKILQFCARAAADGYRYAWADTCCIDKRSSAEISEAINSMYRWYKHSAVCYVYLEDVLDENKALTFAESAWFTRGWTLQELLAPETLKFYDAKWSLLGDKFEFLNQIERVTNIDQKALTGEADLSSYPIATRMSWAASRTTTRSEDMAYSLLGIFDISMPILYGEGSKAFLRLQEHIVRDSDDRSIFCWTFCDGLNSGLLASSPVHFRQSGGLEYSSSNILGTYHLSNRGLSIELLLEPVSRMLYVTPVTVLLERNSMGELSRRDFRIFLGRIHSHDQFLYTCIFQIGDEEANAVDVEPLVTLAVNRKQYFRPHCLERIEVCSKPFSRPEFDLCFTIIDSAIGWGLELSHADALASWDASQGLLMMKPGQLGTAGVFTFTFTPNPAVGWPDADIWPQKMLFGFDVNFDPVCVIASQTCVIQSPDLPTDEPQTSPCCVETHLKDLALEDITCFEGVGWAQNPAADVKLRLNHVVGRSGLWAFKPVSGQHYQLSDTGWTIALTRTNGSVCTSWNVSVGRV